MDKIMKIKDGKRTLFYRKLKKVREDGVSGTLIGYRKNNKNYWY